MHYEFKLVSVIRGDLGSGQLSAQLREPAGAAC